MVAITYIGMDKDGVIVSAMAKSGQLYSTNVSEWTKMVIIELYSDVRNYVGKWLKIPLAMVVASGFYTVYTIYTVCTIQTATASHYLYSSMYAYIYC